MFIPASYSWDLEPTVVTVKSFSYSSKRPQTFANGLRHTKHYKFTCAVRFDVFCQHCSGIDAMLTPQCTVSSPHWAATCSTHYPHLQLYSTLVDSLVFQTKNRPTIQAPTDDHRTQGICHCNGNFTKRRLALDLDAVVWIIYCYCLSGLYDGKNRNRSFKLSDK